MKTLPSYPNLDHLRQQAKDQLGEMRRSSTAGVRLAQAQQAVARDYGFRSWTALKTEVEHRRTRHAAMHSILAGFTSPVPKERFSSMARLEAMGTDGAEGAFTGMTSPNPTIRRWSARFFDHQLLDERSIRALIGLVQDDDSEVRAAAIHVLGCEGCKPDGACLTDDLASMVGRTLIDSATIDSNARVRRMAVPAIPAAAAGLGLDAASILARVLNTDRSARVRVIAVMVIAPIAIAPDVSNLMLKDALIAARDSDPSAAVRELSARILQRPLRRQIEPNSPGHDES